MMMMTTVTTTMMMVLTNDADLAEDLVEVSLVRKEGNDDQNREEEEGDDRFPQVDHVLQI